VVYLSVWLARERRERPRVQRHAWLGRRFGPAGARGVVSRRRRARGAWYPGDDGRAAESELTEWTEPRSDAEDAVDTADDADAERGTRLEYGVPCGSGVDVSAGNASGVGVPGVEADEDQRLRGRGSGADGRSGTSQRPATGPVGLDSLITRCISLWVKTVCVQSMELAGM
jgi:hypothetical protein